MSEKCFPNGSVFLKIECKDTYYFYNFQIFLVFFRNFAPKIDRNGNKKSRIHDQCPDGIDVS